MINLAIFSPNQNAYSETFIQAHKALPFNIFFYYGGYIPTHLEGKTHLLKTRFQQISYKIRHRLGKKLSPKELALKSSLKQNDIHIILAEYGPTAAECLNVVKSLNIPLIAHFHGFDASVKDVIERYQPEYKFLFSYATYVIAVSVKMQKELLALGCPKSKLILNPCGPKEAFSSIAPNLSSKQFVAVGRFVDKKAPYASILAFKKAHAVYPDIRLVMAGDGPLLNTCENRKKWRFRGYTRWYLGSTIRRFASYFNFTCWNTRCGSSWRDGVTV
jgi:colanic acid/amylovoran biosynthesis glycosyltransferase